ncbi:hypothetical protein BDN72DRAFT_567921 [Pluteus cervinus]|uniref:Uncharacterized protein n=1 Tax=Pluteus cervinus TaxID=181527 RepID=A0ACD3A2L5_9AGAR|nr:hypothetical protein BDN72DRAFT_567921 [Pluteus cervinus]
MPPSTIKAKSHIRLEVICNHKKAKDNHAVGVDENCDVLGTISNPNAGVIEVGLSRPGRDKPVGFIRYTMEVLKTHNLRRGTDHQASLSWRTLNSADVIRKVVFNDDMDELVPPQWACIVSSLDGLVKNTQDLAELNSSAKVAVGAVCAAIKLIIDQVERDERVETLTETMSTIYYHVQDTNFDKIKSFEDTLQRLVKMTTECAYFIASYKQKAFARRTLEGAILGVDGIIKDFEERFTQLRIEFLMGSTLQSTHTVLLVLNKVRNIETLLHLQPLSLIENALWRRVRISFSPEQEEVLDGLTIWAQNPNERPVSVLVGDTREEVSLIAHKLCECFSDQKRLGSAVFFPETTESAELSCRFLVSTIARDLAALSPAFAESIAEAIASSPRLARQSDLLDRQFEELLINPLQSLTMVGPVLIVIDGLDRCSDQLRFVQTLGASQKVPGKIPRNVRFLMTYNSEPQLLNPFIELISPSLRIWHTGGEIKSQLITNSFWKRISSDYQGLQLLDGLEDLKMKMMPIYSCAGLEIPPTITPAFLLSEITHVLTKGGHTSLLEPLLNQARQCIPPELMAHFESYMCFVYIQASHWNRPFNVLFVELKGVVELEISAFVQEIANIHHLEGISPDILKLLPEERSDYPKVVPFLVLKYLNTTLTPNICRFEEITKLNKDITDLDHRLSTYVPTTLRRLSGCWSEWVAPYLETLHGDNCGATLSELRTFLSSHLLSWIELISLLGCPDAALKQLQLLEPVLSQMTKGTNASTEDIEFIHNAISDSIHFVMQFQTPIREGGSFVHRLAFLAHTTTFIRQTYAPEHIVKSGLDTIWPYKFTVDAPWSRLTTGQTGNDPVLTSLHPWQYGTRRLIKLWSLETGAHLCTFELPADSFTSTPDHFLALPSKKHFTFVFGGHFSVFRPDHPAQVFERFTPEGRPSSICYTPDETSLAIRTEKGHLYLMDLATSEIRTHLSFFLHPEEQYNILEISPDSGYLATCAIYHHQQYTSAAAIVEVYNIASGLVVRTLEHSHPRPDRITKIKWSEDQLHMITIVQQYSSNCCFLWDVEHETSNHRKLDIGPNGSADFGDNGLVILALKAEIRLVSRSTFETVIAIPIEIHNPWEHMIFGRHGLVMTSLHGGLGFYDLSAKSKSSHSFGTHSPLPQAYQENIFQNPVKHKLRVKDLEFVDGWLMMKPDIKLIWIPFPFKKLVKNKSMDQITISDYYNEVHLVLDCKAMEKYFL